MFRVGTHFCFSHHFGHICGKEWPVPAYKYAMWLCVVRRCVDAFDFAGVISVETGIASCGVFLHLGCVLLESEHFKRNHSSQRCPHCKHAGGHLYIVFLELFGTIVHLVANRFSRCCIYAELTDLSPFRFWHKFKVSLSTSAPHLRRTPSHPIFL